MKIYIIANFTRKLDGEITGRFSYLASELAKRGHQVKLVISDFYHGTKSLRPEPHYEKYDFEIIKCHEPGYKGNVTPQRLYSHYVWGKNVAKYLKTAEKPDVIYCAIPSLTVAVEASKYCKRNNVKFIVDVQDLWPEAFCMVFKNKLFHLAFKPMKWYVNKAYAAADVAIGVSETYVQRILSVNKKINKGVAVFLGNNGQFFEESAKKYKKDYNDDIIRLCYIGTLSQSYDIEMVVDAVAKASLKTNQHIKFVVVGDGVYKEKFETYARQKEIDCEFTGSKDYPEMVGELCACNIVINPIKKGSAASIINKVGDYAQSGLPVINTQESPEYRHLIENYGCGINCECGNSDEVAEAIVKLAQSSVLRNEMGVAAKRFAKDKFDRRYSYSRIIHVIENLK